MDLKLKIWRQKNSKSKGKFVTYRVSNISSDSSFLEMMDVLNEELISKDEEPVAFDHDCREGICGCCSLYINGKPHGPDEKITVCQLHMRKFKDGDTIVIEPSLFAFLLRRAKALFSKLRYFRRPISERRGIKSNREKGDEFKAEQPSIK